ncbi:hypothetical protein [Paragemmobacter aquarius]|uniref:hypothetical protein n=1 Tax=Paragemmobacter aquarius TaxID=2169400 RepID=UPI00131F0C23|nr:hypothetical protein [Gemmobacter aquarius]
MTGLTENQDFSAKNLGVEHVTEDFSAKNLRAGKILREEFSGAEIANGVTNANP